MDVPRHAPTYTLKTCFQTVFCVFKHLRFFSKKKDPLGILLKSVIPKHYTQWNSDTLDVISTTSIYSRRPLGLFREVGDVVHTWMLGQHSLAFFWGGTRVTFTSKLSSEPWTYASSDVGGWHKAPSRSPNRLKNSSHSLRVGSRPQCFESQQSRFVIFLEELCWRNSLHFSFEVYDRKHNWTILSSPKEKIRPRVALTSALEWQGPSQV